ncbi:MAG: hypothetical protein N4A65_12165 [Cohaesibacter sp.]|nr:hypothetical protein [Cohaesibacter sp.]
MVAGLIGISILYVASRFFRYSDLLTTQSGYSSDAAPIVINLPTASLAVPGNMIRKEKQKTSKPQAIADLFFLWPKMSGYSHNDQLAFSDTSENSQLIFVRLSSPDEVIISSEQLSAVYSQHFSGSPLKGPEGLMGFAMNEDSGFAGETIYFKPDESPPFVARCFTPQKSTPTLCMRSIKLTGPSADYGVAQADYRFRKTLLGQWREMDQAVQTMLNGFLIK